jgi:hypothetical protein
MAELAGPERPLNQPHGRLATSTHAPLVRLSELLRQSARRRLSNVPDAADERAPCGNPEVQDGTVRVCAVPDEDALSPTQAGDDAHAVTGSP